jgi:hypothetical protein
MADENLLIFRSINSYKKLERLIFILIILVVFLLVVSFSVTTSEFQMESYMTFGNNDKESGVFSSNFKSDKNDLDKIYIFIFLIILCLVFCCLKLIKKQIVISQLDIKIIDRLFCIRIRSKSYLCETIDKIIIGMFTYKHNEMIYNIYLDKRNGISKIITLRAYEECVKIMNQIKKESGIRIYDGTDDVYKTEEDLFREYYKLKNLVMEVKNE